MSDREIFLKIFGLVMTVLGLSSIVLGTCLAPRHSNDTNTKTTILVAVGIALIVLGCMFVGFSSIQIPNKETP